jgi:pimeloyl-ACP methyl ester carboxylesterase
VTDLPFYAVAPPADEVRAIAVVLHGGRANSAAPVRARQLAVLRMTPFINSLHRAGRPRGLAVARMRYLVRGWNGTKHAPVGDVTWVIDRLAEGYPDVPVALVGHSMGARAAIYAADHPNVSTVVGLAPWLEAGDPYQPVADCNVLVAHGDRDRITSAANSSAWTRSAAAVAACAGFVSVQGDAHAMLRRARLWHELSTGFVLAAMCGVPPDETVPGEAANVLSKILAGQASSVV